jgi:hypothetical protein
MMHNKKIDKDPSLHAVFTKMKKDLSAHLNINQFTRWTAANPYVTSPIMMLQLHIRLQIIGEPFWSKLTTLRKEHPEQGRLDYVKRLQEHVINENRLFQEKIRQEKERQIYILKMKRKGKLDDGRDNITRKQSVVLEYFNMKRLSQRWSRVHRPGAVYADVDFPVEDNEQQPTNNQAITTTAATGGGLGLGLLGSNINKKKEAVEEVIIARDDRELFSDITQEAKEEEQQQRNRSHKNRNTPHVSNTTTPQGSPQQMSRKTPNNNKSASPTDKSKKDDSHNQNTSHKKQQQQPQPHKIHRELLEMNEDDLIEHESHHHLKKLLADDDQHNINQSPLRRRRSSLLRIKPDLVREKPKNKQESGYKANKRSKK